MVGSGGIFWHRGKKLKRKAFLKVAYLIGKLFFSALSKLFIFAIL